MINNHSQSLLNRTYTSADLWKVLTSTGPEPAIALADFEAAFGNVYLKERSTAHTELPAEGRVWAGMVHGIRIGLALAEVLLNKKEETSYSEVANA